MSSIKLSQGTLGAIASSGITVPRYSRDTLAEKPAIVHLGVGGFHRSHMALYTCEALKHPEAQAGSWAICGVGVMPGDASMRDASIAEAEGDCEGTAPCAVVRGSPIAHRIDKSKTKHDKSKPEGTLK